MIKILLNYNVGIFNQESFKSVMELDFSGTETDILVNIFNKEDPLYEKGIETNTKWRSIIAGKMNKGRMLTIKNNYDYMLSVEHDIIADKTSLQKLLKYANTTTVVSGAYRLRKLRNKECPLCWLMGDSKKSRWANDEDIKNKEIINVYLVPYGFTLFPRQVLQQLPLFDQELDGTTAIHLEKMAIQKLICLETNLKHLDRDGGIYEI